MQYFFDQCPLTAALSLFARIKPPIGKPFSIDISNLFELKQNPFTFFHLKQKIYDLKGIPPSEQKIFICQQEMNDFDFVKLNTSNINNLFILCYPFKNPINIIIKWPNGTFLELTADENSKIEDIKYEAFSNFNFLQYQNINIPENVMLTFSGILLDDSRTLNDYLISNSATFYYTELKPREIIIFIKYSDEYVPVLFSPTDKISSIKSKICDLLQIDLSSQILLFEGKQLQDQDRILDYSIYSEATIELKTAQNSDETDISSQNESNTNSKVTVYVQIFSESKVQIECDPCEDVRSFKKLVEAKTGIKVKNQKLLFYGKQLSDEYRLDKYTITDDSVILLIPFEEKSVTITVYLLHDDYHTLVSLEAKPTCFIKDFKENIFERTRIPSDKQSLILKHEILSDDLSLQSYDINADAGIELVHLTRGGKIIIFKESEWKHIPIEVKDDDPIEYVINILSMKQEIPSEQIILSVESFQETSDGDEVWFFHKFAGSIHVFVQHFGTQKIQVFYIRPEDRIEELKAKIEDFEGIPVDKQRLVYSGHMLDDESLIKDYNISDNSKIYLVPILRG